MNKIFIHVPLYSLLYGLPATHINKLQRVQNAAARLICSIPRFSHVTPVLYSLHWLPVQFRIDFKILIITFKAIHGHAPEYIHVCNLIRIKTPSTYGLRSNSELLLAPPSMKMMKTLGDRALLLLHHHFGTNCQVKYGMRTILNVLSLN